MAIITIQEAQALLPEVIHRLTPGDEVVITENDQPIARLLPSIPQAPAEPPRLETLRGTVQYMAPDFGAPLEDFKEHME